MVTSSNLHNYNTVYGLSSLFDFGVAGAGKSNSRASMARVKFLSPPTQVTCSSHICSSTRNVCNIYDILLCLVAQRPSRCQVERRKWHTPDLGCEEPKSLSEGQLSHRAEEIGQLCGSCILLVGLLVRVTWQGRAACLHSLGLGGLSGSTPLVATISCPGPTGGPSPKPLCLGGHHGGHPDATGPAPAQRVAARIEDIRRS